MQGADYVKALLAGENGTRAVVLPTAASQVEVKAVFACSPRRRSSIRGWCARRS